MRALIESLQARLEELLDKNYLFDHDQKRLRSNMKILVVVLLVADVINAIGILATYVNRSTIVGGLLPVILSVLVYWAVSNIESTNASVLLVAGLLHFCMWSQLAFNSVGYFGLLSLLLYPMAICFFMGNRFAIPMLIIMSCNLMFYLAPIFDVWRDKLFIIAKYEGNMPIQFMFTFLCACFFGMAVEYIHSRTNMHLAIFANQITENSYKDPLTGLLTRRAFYERYCREIEEMGASNTPVFLIMCDVDHFKAVNDTYGHAVGDEILKHVSKVLLQYSMGKNLCFRWGGEEFIMFMGERTLTKAITTANRIRVVLEHSPYIDPQIGSIKATMSFGVHQFDSTLTMDKNISVVDEYLYAAKRNGRNRVESAPLKSD